MATITRIVNAFHLAHTMPAYPAPNGAAASTVRELERGVGVSGPYITPLIPLRQADKVELSINGDGFDFLVTTPYDLNGVIDVKSALEKLEKTPTALWLERKNSMVIR